MSASPSISLSAAAGPGPSRSHGPSPSDEGRGFDAHLHTARGSEQRPPRDTAEKPEHAAASGTSARTRTDSVSSPKADTKGDPSQPPRPAHADDDRDTNAAQAAASGLAGAMLALLRQAPAASASAVTGGAAKLLAAGALKKSGNVLLAGAGGEENMLTAALGASVVADAQPSPDSFRSALGTSAVTLPLAAIKDKGGPAIGDISVPTPAPMPPSAAAPALPLHIASAPGTPAFAQELGQHIAWLGGQEIKQARIRLHPEDLGQLDLKVSVQHDNKVDVSFVVQHPHTVHMLQQTLGQLDAMLAQQGLSLGQADVGHQQSSGSGSPRHAGNSGSSSITDAGEPTAPLAVNAVGLLDMFA